MVKVKVIKQFRDISDFALIHLPGEVLEVSEARAKELEELGLVTPIVTSETKKTKKTEE